MNTENKQMPAWQGAMRLIRRGSIALGVLLLAGCGKHLLRCDAHLTPINPPEPPALPAGGKPSERGSP